MKDVVRGQDIMETKAMPIIIAALTRYIISKAVTKPPQNIPIQTFTIVRWNRMVS